MLKIEPVGRVGFIVIDTAAGEAFRPIFKFPDTAYMFRAYVEREGGWKTRPIPSPDIAKAMDAFLERASDQDGWRPAFLAAFLESAEYRLLLQKTEAAA